MTEMSDLPSRVDALIRIHEERLNQELRELTGRDDIHVKFDRTGLNLSAADEGWPVPAALPEDYWESAE